MTVAEQHLWKFLRNCRQNHIRFRRQHGIGPYIVDFYCPQVRLIIEIDGDVVSIVIVLVSVLLEFPALSFIVTLNL